MDSEISQRISITRYFMVIGIIVLHLPPYVALSDTDGSVMGFIKAFFSHGVFRATVPMLTVMSGYLLFRSSLDQRFTKLLSKKTKALLIPLILWNLPLAIAVYAVQKYGLLGHSFSAVLYPFDLSNWVNALTGLNGLPINYPLNFLRDLWVICLLAPIMGWFLRRAPWVGFILLAIVYAYNLDKDLVLRNSMLISFYLGGLAAVLQWNLKALDRFAVPALVLFVGCAICIVIFKIENREWFRLIAPIMIWPAISLLVGTRAGHWLNSNAKHSFFTFLCHGPIILVFWIVFSKTFPAAPYALFWFAAPVITVWLALIMNKGLHRYFPKFANVIVGQR
jgi:succinoglycan biosynthesis protein ExoH